MKTGWLVLLVCLPLGPSSAMVWGRQRVAYPYPGLFDKFGGRWASTTFEPGDVVILNMFIMHASLTNMTNKYRISCDTRYQLASEPIDERWAGKEPKTHTEFWAKDVQLEPVEVSRQKWGV